MAMGLSVGFVRGISAVHPLSVFISFFPPTPPPAGREAAPLFSAARQLHTSISGNKSNTVENIFITNLLGGSVALSPAGDKRIRRLCEVVTEAPAGAGAWGGRRSPGCPVREGPR